MVLIHGFASSTLVWSKVFLAFAKAGYRVIALDLLGYGYSAKPRNGEYTIEGQAKLSSSTARRTQYSASNHCRQFLWWRSRCNVRARLSRSS